MNTIPGMIIGESNADYHANKAVSFSKLKDFMIRPSLFKKKHIDGEVEKTETEAMFIGSATHTLVLEGEEEFKRHFEVLPESFDGRTKDGKALIHDIQNALGKVPLKYDQFRQVKALKDSVKANPLAVALLSKGVPEVTWRLKGELYDLQCRTDWYCDCAPDFGVVSGLPFSGEPYNVDYKTTQSLDDWTSKGRNNILKKFRYHEQAAFYPMVQNRILKAANIDTVKRWYFIVTEKQEPMETAVFSIDETTMAHAQIHISGELSKLSECYRSGVWHGFDRGRGVVETGISEYILQKEDEDRW